MTDQSDKKFLTREVWLWFNQYGHARPDEIRIGWPVERPLLWAELHTDPPEVPRLNKMFVRANIPAGYSLFFAVATEGEHWSLKPLLDAGKETYYEKVEPRTGVINLSFRKRPPQIRTILLGSTNRTEIIDAIFDHYDFEWQSIFRFPFLVAKEEPPAWRDLLEGLMKTGVVTVDMIDHSHCVMWTYWDHGIKIVSNKITRTETEATVQDIAAKLSLKLKVFEDTANRVGN